MRMPEGDVTLRFIDVDYYLPMSSYLTGQDAFVYGFSPTRASGLGKDGSWYYFKQDNVYFHANSGYEAKHGLWNYGADFCTNLTLTRAYVYRVCRLDMGLDRVLTYLSFQYSEPAYWHWVSYLPGLGSLKTPVSGRHYLRRHRVTFGDVTAFRYWDNVRGLMVTFARQGPNSKAVVLTNEVFTEMCDAARHSKLTLHNAHTIAGEEPMWTIVNHCPEIHLADLDIMHRGWYEPGVASNVNVESIPVDTGEGRSDPQPSAPSSEALVDHSTAPRTKVDKGKKKAECPCPLHVDVEHHGEALAYVQSKELTPIEKANTGTTVVLPTLLSTKVRAPIKSKDSLKAAVQTRVMNVGEHAEKRCKLTFDEIGAAARLVHRHVFGGKTFVPASNEEVIKRVPARNRDTVDSSLFAKALPPRKEYGRVKPFVKAEIYPEIKDPRLITPLNEIVQANFYKFVYPVQDALEACQWFAFGRPVKQLVRNIAEVSARAMKCGYICMETDYSRFDGSCTKRTRKIEELVYRYLYGCPQKDQYQVQPLLKMCLDHSRNLTYHGLDPKHYKTLFARCSGAPDTCLMNSILNWLVAASALGPTVASESCFFGGDDGILFIREQNVQKVIDMAEHFGFSMKAKVCRPNESGFTFLSRHFMWGDVNSMAGPDRLVPKLTILNHAVPEKYQLPRLLLKVRSLLESDSNTPGISDMMKKLRDDLELKVTAKMFEDAKVHYRPSWDILKEKLGAWPNEYRAWMADVWHASAVYKSLQ
jgi:hypothetical protein